MTLPDASVRVVCADRVLTMQAAAHAGEWAELGGTSAIAVLGERVVATGTRAGLLAQFPSAPVIDYGDATIVPGFNDAHLHLMMMAAQLLGVDLSPETTPDRQSLAAKVEQARAENSSAWIRASRYDHTATTDGHILTRDELDELAPHTPLVIAHVGAHWAVVNSAALRLAGVDESTPDPPGGGYGRDEQGRLNGHVAEQAMFDFVYPSLSTKPEVAANFTDDEATQAIREAGQVLLAAGITSVGDAMVGPVELRQLQLARSSGDLGVRVNALITFPHLDSLAAVGITNGFGDEWLRIGGIKAFIDGAVAGHSCAVREPFEDDENDRGILTTDADALRDLAERAERSNLALAVHANGERAIEMLLDVLEGLPARVGPPLRHRIEHCSIVTPELVKRIAALDLIVVPFCSYPLYHGDKLLTWYGHERVERMFAHRWFLDAGVTVAASSDYPCGPHETLLGLQSLTMRTSRTGAPVGLSQRISLHEALALYSTGSAAAAGETHFKGSLAPGNLADLTVLSGDLISTDPDQLGNTRVLATWVGGRESWCAPYP